MFTYVNSIYVYTGFNGIMLGDMLTFDPGKIMNANIIVVDFFLVVIAVTVELS